MQIDMDFVLNFADFGRLFFFGFCTFCFTRFGFHNLLFNSFATFCSVSGLYYCTEKFSSWNFSNPSRL